MTTDDQMAENDVADGNEASLAAPWYIKHRRALFIAGGIVAILVVLAVLIANTPAPAWGTPSQNIGHPLALLTDPSQPGTLYVGTEQGKVYSSGDGASWTNISNGLPANAPVSALAQTGDGAHLLAGTSNGLFAYSQATRTWAALGSGLPQGDGIDALAFASTNDQNILAGTEQHGVFRSTDGGKTWTAASGLPVNADVYGVTVLPDFQTAYAALIGAGIFQSTDDGATWVAANTGLPAQVNAFTVIDATPTNGPATLVAGTSQGIFRSTDGAKTWVASSQGIGTTRVISLATDSHQAGFILAGTDAGVFQSLDNGATWRGVAQGLPTGAHVGAVAVTIPNGGTAYYFAATDAMYRYPGFTTSFISYAVRGIILALLIGVVFLVGRRQQRITRSMIPPTPPPDAPQSNGTLRGAGAPGTITSRTTGARPPPIRPGATGHIRGGPPPRPTPQPPAEE
jgi:photosystem II stability/assembly factor-like uncharacterized protein